MVLDPTKVDGLFGRIDAITLDEANAATWKYYRADHLTFVVFGNASKIRDAVRKYATNVIELSISSGFSLSPDVQIITLDTSTSDR